MWRLDIHGTPLDDADAAREELRRRAWLAISDGLRAGRDVRHHRVRVRSETGVVVFAGTLAEAIANDTRCPALFTGRSTETVTGASRRLRQEVLKSRQALQAANVRLSETIASAREELRIAQQLVTMSRRYGLREQPAPR